MHLCSLIRAFLVCCLDCLRRVMRKTSFCICENKDADQRHCFRYINSTIPLLPINYKRSFKPLAIFCGCIARFVSELVENPEDQFSHNTASMIPLFSSSAVCFEYNMDKNSEGRFYHENAQIRVLLRHRFTSLHHHYDL